MRPTEPGCSVSRDANSICCTTLPNDRTAWSFGDELLREIWGYPDTPNTRSVDHAIARLRKKIEEDPRHPRFVVTVHGDGYQMRTVPASRTAAAVKRDRRACRKLSRLRSEPASLVPPDDTIAAHGRAHDVRLDPGEDHVHSSGSDRIRRVEQRAREMASAVGAHEEPCLHCRGVCRGGACAHGRHR